MIKMTKEAKKSRQMQCDAIAARSLLRARKEEKMFLREKKFKSSTFIPSQHMLYAVPIHS